MGKRSKEKKEPTYCLTLSQLEAMKTRAVREATEAAWILMLAIPVMVLMDKHGFEQEQLGKVVDQILEKYEAFEQGYFTLEDARRVILEEAGAEIQLPNKQNRII